MTEHRRTLKDACLNTLITGAALTGIGLISLNMELQPQLSETALYLTLGGISVGILGGIGCEITKNNHKK